MFFEKKYLVEIVRHQELQYLLLRNCLNQMEPKAHQFWKENHL